MALAPDLERISSATLASYAQRADAFCEGTRDHDVSQNIDALLSHIDGAAAVRILDFGCGPGRDLATFRGSGTRPVGLDGAARFVDDGARRHRLRGVAPGFPRARPAGGALRRRLRQRVAVPRADARSCRACSRELRATLRPGGVLFSSNPHGDNERRLERRPLRRLPRSRDVAATRRPTPASSSSSTTTARRACRARSSRGSRPCGASAIRLRAGGNLIPR